MSPERKVYPEGHDSQTHSRMADTIQDKPETGHEQGVLQWSFIN